MYMMKLATHLSLSLLLMISIRGCAAATGEFSSSSNADAVVDADGDEVMTGVEYKLWASSGGGFSLASSTACKPCPLDVVQESSNLNLGLPVTFHPINPGSVVRVSTDLNIKFNAAESRVWNLEHDRCINRSVITTSGGGVNGWFKFEKVAQFQFVYKIVSCRDSFAPCGQLAYPADDQFNSTQRRLFISSSAPSTTDIIFWVLIAKANYTQAHNNFNLMMNISKGILTSH